MTLVWTINYTESARKQLGKLDKQIARRILDFMDERIAAQEDPRNTGKALTGPMLGAYWRYRIGCGESPFYGIIFKHSCQR